MVEVNRRPIPKVPALRGRTVVSLFYEDSTRTRLSFETAAKRLSADTMSFSVSSSSVNKGESVRDTVETIEAMGVDAIVVRHKSSGVPAADRPVELGRGDQRRRRLAPAPHPGAARRLHDPVATSDRSRVATSRSSATSSTRGWRARNIEAFTDARCRGHARRSADAVAAVARAVAGQGVATTSTRCCRRSTSATCCACSSERMTEALVPTPA